MFCDACGDQVPESSKFCGSCGASLSPQPVPTKRTARQVYETKSSGTAIVLSFFWTGLGQLYAGTIARGLVMIGITPIIWAIGWFGGFATFFGGLGTIVGRTAQESSSWAGFGLMGFFWALPLSFGGFGGCWMPRRCVKPLTVVSRTENRLGLIKVISGESNEFLVEHILLVLLGRCHSGSGCIVFLQ